MKVKPSTSNFFKKAYWWFKATLLVVAISTITYGIGTFTPNPIAVKQATEEVRIEHAEWAEKLGLNEPSFEYTNSKEFIIELNKCVDFLNYHTPPDKRVINIMSKVEKVLNDIKEEVKQVTILPEDKP